MSAYECFSSGFALVAIVIACLSYRRSGKAVSIAEAANQIFSDQLRESAALNAPNIVFNCRVEPHGLAYTIVIAVINSGGHTTEIVNGEIRLHSSEYPEANKSCPLTGQKIGGGAEYLVKFEAKASFIHSLSPGIAPAEIICKAKWRDRIPLCVRHGKSKFRTQEIRQTA
jgi:hypothetical protein